MEFETGWCNQKQDRGKFLTKTEKLQKGFSKGTIEKKQLIRGQNEKYTAPPPQSHRQNIPEQNFASWFLCAICEIGACSRICNNLPHWTIKLDVALLIANLDWSFSNDTTK